jgi:hypothetical protein
VFAGACLGKRPRFLTGRRFSGFAGDPSVVNGYSLPTVYCSEPGEREP